MRYHTAGKGDLLRRRRDPAGERTAAYIVPEPDHAGNSRPAVLAKPVSPARIMVIVAACNDGCHLSTLLVTEQSPSPEAIGHWRVRVRESK